MAEKLPKPLPMQIDSLCAVNKTLRKKVKILQDELLHARSLHVSYKHELTGERDAVRRLEGRVYTQETVIASAQDQYKSEQREREKAQRECDNLRRLLHLVLDILLQGNTLCGVSEDFERVLRRQRTLLEDCWEPLVRMFPHELANAAGKTAIIEGRDVSDRIFNANADKNEEEK